MSDQAPAITGGAAATAAPNTVTPTPAILNTPNASALPAPAAAATTSRDTADVVMAQALVAGGHWTEEQAAAALAEGDAEHDGEAAAEGAEPFNQYAALADMKSTLDAVGIDAKDAGGAECIVKMGLARAPTPEQNAQECAETLQHLDGIYGQEKAGWVVEWARREFQHLAAANPKLVDLAERSGAGNNLALIKALANRGMTRHYKAYFGK
jgi:hypothetical protein